MIRHQLIPPMQAHSASLTMLPAGSGSEFSPAITKMHAIARSILQNPQAAKKLDVSDLWVDDKKGESLVEPKIMSGN
jgi:hypothetical protein